MGLFKLKCAYAADCKKDADNRRGNISKYCTDHHCEELITSNNCTRRCHHKKSKSEKYCKDHRCGFTGCREERGNNNTYCNSHKCEATGCGNIRRLEPKFQRYYGRYCVDHCCNVSGCQKQKVDYGMYCDAHECELKNCHNHRKISTISKFFYCSQHNCEMDGCIQLKSVDKAMKSENLFCVDHIPKFCNWKYSGGCKEMRSKFGYYCEDHTCESRTGCFDERLRDQKLCSKHYIPPTPKCIAQPCKYGKLDGFEFCTNHKCSHQGCKNQQGRGPFCLDHACQKPSCKNPKVYHIGSNSQQRSEYCSSHKCKEDTCHREGKAVEGYCVYHGCRDSECSNEKSSDPSLDGMCAKHFMKKQLAAQAKAKALALRPKARQ